MKSLLPGVTLAGVLSASAEEGNVVPEVPRGDGSTLDSVERPLKTAESPSFSGPKMRVTKVKMVLLQRNLHWDSNGPAPLRDEDHA